MVGRILGLGDVLGLIERVEGAVDRDQAEEMVRKLRRSEFTLEDYRDQLRQMRRLGKLEEVIAMIPGVGGAIKGANLDEGEREMKRAGAIIDSMTKMERRDPAVIGGSRRKRIALGSGTRVEDVNRLLRNFAQTRKAMKQMMGAGGGMKAMKRFAARMPQFGR
jgi:signal recognition particle subunit SRP54